MERDDTESERDHVERVIAAHGEELLRVPGVVGVGVGNVDGRPVIEVLVDDEPESVRARLPTELEGARVHVTRTGTIEALGRD